MNPILNSYKPSENYFALNRANYALLQQLLILAGESLDVLAVLAPDCKPSYKPVLECRKAEWVEYFVAALTAGAVYSSLPDLNSCDPLDVLDIEIATGGYNAQVQGLANSFASFTTALAGANNDIVWTAKTEGDVGNDITIRYVDPGGVTAALGVVVTGTDIVVNLARTASAISTTATALLAAVAANAPANALIGGANAAGNSGAGLVTALAKTSLTGGVYALDQVPTVDLEVGHLETVLIGGAFSRYVLTAGTTAESLPTVIRPNDYGASNQKIWVLTTAPANPAVRKVSGTIVATGTTGVQTINKPVMVVNVEATASTKVVNNSLAVVGMVVLAHLLTVDGTAKSVVAKVTGAGVITLTLNAAATAEVAVYLELVSVQ